MSGVEHFVALEGARDGWLDDESLLAPATFTRPAIAETDLQTINNTSGTTARPKGVMITHRNAWVNSVGAASTIGTWASTQQPAHTQQAAQPSAVPALATVPDASLSLRGMAEQTCSPRE